MIPGTSFRGARSRARGGHALAALAIGIVLLAGCQQAAPPVPPAPSTVPAPGPAVPESPPPKSVPAIVVPPGVTLPSLDFPPGPLYVCDASGAKTAIEYEPRVDKLCRRHPEMGPCQYERNQCRSRGGRVYTQKGEEVTLAVEGEYDRIVRRVRFQADGGEAAKAPAKAPAKSTAPPKAASAPKTDAKDKK